MPKGIPKDYKRPSRNPDGRPHIKIDWQLVDKYLMAACSGQQIAAVLGIHPETLYDAVKREKNVSFSNYSLEKKEKGDAALLGKQFQKAMDGDNTQLVWLGKNRLKQTDKMEQKVDVQSGIRIYLPDNGMDVNE